MILSLKKTLSPLVAMALTVGSSAAIAETKTGYGRHIPRLVLQITVDQLRADLIERYSAGFGQDGFRYLLNNGSVYTNAHHRHANTETIVGHTTLATGADPAVHGMVANLWFDRKTGQQVYNVQDPDYPLVGAKGIDKDAEIDPTQRAATTDGRSPRNIATSTLSDEMAQRFGPGAKIFGVSVKDRGAISMAGHGGQAYWFSKAEGRFVTSTYYRDDYPGWIADWDAKGLVGAYAGQHWNLLLDRSQYQFSDRDDQPWETEMPGYGRVFPHAFGPADSPYFTTFLTLSPAGDALTVDFAKTLLVAEQLGQDEIPDFLSVSLSSTDYVGHIFGPSSLESEDNLKHLDRQLAGLLAFVDETVGLENTLVVLSADHGAAENPGYLATVGIEAQLFDFDAVDTGPGLTRLKQEFGVSQDLIRNFSQPYVYLDQQVIADRGLDPATVEAAVAGEIARLPGIAFAVGSTALRQGAVADTEVSRTVLRNFNADRSGDIYVVFEPHWFVADFDGLHVAASHGSPWGYDTHVPVILSGPGVPVQSIARRVETVALAPTIALYLGTKIPSGSSGDALWEVLD